MDAEIVWAKLAEAGWVRGEMPAAGEPPAPWYLRAMIGIAAWIAAAFVLSSVGALVYRVFDSATLSIVTGSILCATAATMMHRSREGLFLRQFGLAIAIAGESLLALGLYTAVGLHRSLGWLAIAAVQVVLVVVIRDPTHRIIAAFFAMSAAFLGALQFGTPALLPPIAAVAFAATALAADRSAAQHALLQPASTGIALALLLFAPVAIILDDTSHRTMSALLANARWLQPMLLAATFAGVAAVLLHRARIDDKRIVVAAALAIVALIAVTWPVQGLLAALIVIVVAFAMGRPALTGLGLVTAAAMLGYYYFSLQTTLMTKSLSLMVAGVVLLVAGWALSRVEMPADGGRHA